MDLSNLSHDLPPTKSLEQVSLLDINKDLTGEFKNAAKSVATLYNASSQKADGKGEKNVKKEFADSARAVASLYRVGSNSTVLSMHKGYLDCLDELLGVISREEDIENWVLTKRAELTNLYHHKETSQTASPVVQAEPEAAGHLPAEHDFSFPADLTSSLSFRPSFPPKSVQYKWSKLRPDQLHKKPAGENDFSGASSGCESDMSEPSDDLGQKKRKARRAYDAFKRRKRDSSSDSD